MVAQRLDRVGLHGLRRLRQMFVHDPNEILIELNFR